MSKIRSLAKNFIPHLIAVSKTWCTDKVADALVDIELRNDRGLINVDSQRDTLGTGVALYVHKSLSFSINATIRSRTLSLVQIEYLIQKVCTSSGSSALIKQGSGPGPVMLIVGTDCIATRVANSNKKFFVDDEDFDKDGTVGELSDIILDLNEALEVAVHKSSRMRI